MARKRDVLHAVHDKDLRQLAENLGISERLDRGLLRCEICDISVNWDNLQAIFPKENRVAVLCDRPDCLLEVLLASG